MNASSPRERVEFGPEKAKDFEREERRRNLTVQTPGATPWEPAPWKAQLERSEFERAQALAQLDRDISAQRFHVRQLQLCAQDTDFAARGAYAAQQQAAEKVLADMEARATVLRTGAPR